MKHLHSLLIILMFGALLGSVPLSASASVDGYIEQQQDFPSVVCATELEGDQPDDLVASSHVASYKFRSEQVAHSVRAAYSLANYLDYHTRAPPYSLNS